MILRTSINGLFRLPLLLVYVFVLSGSAVLEKRTTTISIKAQNGGPDGFEEVIYERKGRKIELQATGTGHVKINDLLAEAVSSDTVFVNMYQEIVQMIALGSTKNVMVDVHLRSHATAHWHWQDAGNFKIELNIRKK